MLLIGLRLNQNCTENISVCRCRRNTMSLIDYDDSEETAAISCSHDESLSDLVRFVDAASNSIRQTLDRHRHRSRRPRVNHRKFIARLASGLDVTGRDRRPSLRDADRQSRRSARSVRTREGRTTQAVEDDGGGFTGHGETEHIRADEFPVDAAVTGRLRWPGLPLSSAMDVQNTQFIGTNQVPPRMTSDVCYEPLQSWISYPSAVPSVCHLSHQFSVGNSFPYETGLCHCCSTTAQRVNATDFGDCLFWRSSSVGAPRLLRQRAPFFGEQMPTSAACHVGNWLRTMSSASPPYDQNDDDEYFGANDYSPQSSCANISSLGVQESVQNQPSTAWQCGFETLAVDRDWTTVQREDRDLVNTSLLSSSCNDSGFGSVSFESVVDVDGSNTTQTSSLLPFGYDFCSSQTESFNDISIL